MVTLFCHFWLFFTCRLHLYILLFQVTILYTPSLPLDFSHTPYIVFISIYVSVKWEIMPLPIKVIYYMYKIGIYWFFPRWYCIIDYKEWDVIIILHLHCIVYASCKPVCLICSPELMAWCIDKVSIIHFIVGFIMLVYCDIYKMHKWPFVIAILTILAITYWTDQCRYEQYTLSSFQNHCVYVILIQLP